MVKTFKINRLVRHGHTDPAGIVYYPRYYEMINDTIEDFFAVILNRPFAHMHMNEKRGIPLVSMETQFIAPSYCGDTLTFELGLARLGTSSITFDISASCGTEERLAARLTMIHTDLKSMKSIPFDDDLRSILSAYLIAEKEGNDR